MKNRTLRLVPFDTCDKSIYAQRGTQCLGLIVHRTGNEYATNAGAITGTLVELVKHYENLAYFAKS